MKVPFGGFHTKYRFQPPRTQPPSPPENADCQKRFTTYEVVSDARRVIIHGTARVSTR
jgi:hypothetical protein